MLNTTTQDTTPRLLQAISEGRYAEVGQLIKKANVRAIDSKGNTVLHLAVMAPSNQPELVKFLVSHGARELIDQKNHAGKTVSDLVMSKKDKASKVNNDIILNFLREQRANLRYRSAEEQANQLGAITERQEAQVKKELGMYCAALEPLEERLRYLGIELELAVIQAELIGAAIGKAKESQSPEMTEINTRYQGELQSLREDAIANYTGLCQARDAVMDKQTGKLIELSDDKARALIDEYTTKLEQILANASLPVTEQHTFADWQQAHQACLERRATLDKETETLFEQKTRIAQQMLTDEQEHSQSLKVLSDARNESWRLRGEGLHGACTSGNLERVKALTKAQSYFERRAFINQLNEKGMAPLHIACIEGHVELVRWLLGHQAAPYQQNHYGFTPLHFAARRGDVAVINALLVKLPQAEVNSWGKFGRTPLEVAAFHGKTEAIRALVAAGANINVKSKKEGGEKTPLISALTKGHEQAALCLLELNANPWLPTGEGKENALHIAAFYGMAQVVAKLLAHPKGSHINATNAKGETALHFAAEAGHLLVVEKLLAAGATSTTTADEQTALQRAERRNHTQVVEALQAHANAPVLAQATLTPLRDGQATNSEEPTVTATTAATLTEPQASQASSTAPGAQP